MRLEWSLTCNARQGYTTGSQRVRTPSGVFTLETLDENREGVFPTHLPGQSQTSTLPYSWHSMVPYLLSVSWITHSAGPRSPSELKDQSPRGSAEPGHPVQHGIPDKGKSQIVDKQTFPWKWPSGNGPHERGLLREHCGHSQGTQWSPQVKIKQKEVGLGNQAFKGNTIKEEEGKLLCAFPS